LATRFPGQLAPCTREKGRGGNWGGHPHHSVVKVVKHGKKHQKKHEKTVKQHAFRMIGARSMELRKWVQGSAAQLGPQLT